MYIKERKNMSSEKELTYLKLIKNQLVQDIGLWSILISSLIGLVFVQSLFIGFRTGVAFETVVNPSNFDNPIGLSEAFKGWTIFIIALTSVLMIVLSGISIMTIISERRKTLTILRSIGVCKSNILKINIFESMIVSLFVCLSGLAISLLLGILLNMNYLNNSLFTTYSVPFKFNIFMLLPLFIINFSVITTSYLTQLKIFDTPIIEVLSYE